jgi:hypothetical protein
VAKRQHKTLTIDEDVQMGIAKGLESMGKGLDALLRGKVQGQDGHLAFDACLFFDLGNGLLTLADCSASYRAQ